MRVLLADDEDKVRSALRLVMDLEPDLEVIAEVTTPDQLLDTIEETQPDLLLLDWDILPYGKGSFIKILVNHYPQLYVIVTSACVLSKQDAISAGANAFVSKVEPVERFIASLRRLVELKNAEI
jgi:DNA-binding NarL/FixJ family response regulator